MNQAAQHVDAIMQHEILLAVNDNEPTAHIKWLTELRDVLVEAVDVKPENQYEEGPGTAMG